MSTMVLPVENSKCATDATRTVYLQDRRGAGAEQVYCNLCKKKADFTICLATPEAFEPPTHLAISTILLSHPIGSWRLSSLYT